MSQIIVDPPDARRDQWGRYKVVPPGESSPAGYTRVTTVAKTLDAGGGLAAWKAAMALQGAFARKGLWARWEALSARYNGDPWYTSADSKKETKELVEECASAGGADDRRHVGSALHTVTALLDVGRSPTGLSEETVNDIEAYRLGLIESKVTIVPDMVEVTVVLDEWQVAGTFDRLVCAPGFPLPLIADLKTGGSLEYSWQTIAVQMAAYSRANNIYVQGPANDGSADVRLAMPKVQQDYGLIMWLPAGQARLELWLVDLRLGWEAFGQSMWTRGWRGANPQLRFEQYQPDLTVPLAQSVIETAPDRHEATRKVMRLLNPPTHQQGEDMPIDIGSGASASSAKFETKGEEHGGIIVNAEKRQAVDFATGERKTWSNGDPVMQYAITVVEDDTDEELTIWAKGGKYEAASGSGQSMMSAIDLAVRAANCGAIEEGGRISVTWTGLGPAKTGLNAPKLFTATYQPPPKGIVVGNGDRDLNDEPF